MKKLLALAPLLFACAAPPLSLSSAAWEPTPTGSDASLRGLDVVDAATVWACGSGGTVLRTTDGGASWDRFTVPGDERELRDVYALDAKTAYVLAVTEPAGILRTTDGGVTWQELYRSPHATAFLDSFTFFDDGNACVFGDPIDGTFLVLRTDDAGASWEEVAAEHLPPAAEGEAAFAASGTCVVSVGTTRAWIATGGKTSRVLRTADAGRTWTAAATPMLAGQSTTGTYSIAFRDAKHGVIVGGDYTKPEEAERNAAFTTDGGRTWRLADVLPRGQRAAVAWAPGRKDTLLCVGRTGTEISEDGGRTWLPLSDAGFYALAFAPSGEGWAVGADGRAARLVLADE